MSAKENQRAMLDPKASEALTLAINLRHLHAFLSVCSTGSISRSADALYRVPSAVTRSVSVLEAGLGVPLFERKARGMLPNVFGELVLARVQRIDQEFVAARASFAVRAGERVGPDLRSLFGSMFNGRRLAVFASLAEMHNMPAVARVFGITQPAISATVKDLETRLGLDLFERSAQGVTPTEAGIALAFHFRLVLSELRKIIPDIAAVQGTLQGTITVGALPLSRTHVLPSAIAALLACHPQLRVTTVESPYEVLAAGLRSGDIDFIIGALRPDHDAKDLQQEALFKDRISVVVRSGHRLTRQRRVDFDELHRAQWVLPRPNSPSRQLLERSFREMNQPLPAPAVETGDLALLRGLLLQSDMVTAISAHQLRYEIDAGTLAALNFPLEKTTRDIGIAERRASFSSPGARALIEEIREVVRREIRSF